jgi:outer membrane immunogenic protein
MKRSLLLGAGLAAFFASVGSLHAADIGRQYVTKAPVTAPIPYYNWSGPYVGISGGWGWGDSSHAVGVPGFALSSGDFNVDGGLIGLTLGFNYQTGPWVLGIEGDISWTDISGGTTVAGVIPPGVLATGTFTSSLDWLGTVRGRIGYAFDRLLPYVTGGVAFGDVNGAYLVTTPAGTVAGAGSDTKVGWTVGAGFEYGFTPNLSAKTEYLYVDLGKATAAPADRVDFTTHILRAGLNWRF